MNINLKSQKGVTLIALVTIIIVLLILAGISVAMLTGDNGIIDHAQEAKHENSVGEDKDIIKSSFSAAEMSLLKKADGKREHLIDAESLQTQILADMHIESGVTVTGSLEDGQSFTVTMPSGRSYTVGKNATITEN